MLNFIHGVRVKMRSLVHLYVAAGVAYLDNEYGLTKNVGSNSLVKSNDERFTTTLQLKVPKLMVP